MRDRIEALTTDFVHCSRLDLSQGGRQAIELIQQFGGIFLNTTGHWVHHDPFSLIDAKGSVWSGLCVQHNKLQPDFRMLDRILYHNLSADTKPWALFSFLQSLRKISLSQDVFYRFCDLTDKARRVIDSVALGQLSLATALYPALGPSYGWIDEPGSNEPRGESLRLDTVEQLMWANFFCPDHANAIGKEFLASAPGWTLVSLSDGGLLYVTSESYLDWRLKDQTAILDYFRTKFPDIQLYRAEEFPS
jgi:hypothetical protein